MDYVSKKQLSNRINYLKKSYHLKINSRYLLQFLLTFEYGNTFVGLSHFLIRSRLLTK